MAIDLFSVSIGIPGIVLVIIGTILMLKYRNEYPTSEAITKYERNYIDKWGVNDPEINKRTTRTIKTPGTLSFGTTDAMDKFWKYWDRRKNIGTYLIIIGLCFQGILVSYEIFYDPNQIEQFGFLVDPIMDCPEHFIIFENNCVPVNTENREVHDASMFFNSIDGKMTELCEIEFGVSDVETCQEIKFYTIENNEIKFYLPANYSRPYDGLDTINPNECWYDDGDGNILPCKIETGPILWPSFSPIDSNCDEICLDENEN